MRYPCERVRLSNWLHSKRPWGHQQQHASIAPLLKSYNSSQLRSSRTAAHASSCLIRSTESDAQSHHLSQPRRNWSHIAHRPRSSPLTSSNFIAASAMASSPNVVQARGHMGHSHSHHHHDNTYLTSANKNDPGVRITRVGLYVNLGMAIAKGAGGYAFNSQAYVHHIHFLCRDPVPPMLSNLTPHLPDSPPTPSTPSQISSPTSPPSPQSPTPCAHQPRASQPATAKSNHWAPSASPGSCSQAA